MQLSRAGAALTGRNLPRGDEWACQIRDNLIMSIDCKFNFTDRIVSGDACADICSLITLLLIPTLTTVCGRDGGVLMLAAIFRFKTHPGGIYFSRWGLVISILRALVSGFNPVQKTAAAGIHPRACLCCCTFKTTTPFPAESGTMWRKKHFLLKWL